jgi:hypothetical protein
VAGICFVRDARDILPFLCGHYLRLGFDHLRFVDDGSTDGTHELLHRLSSCTDRVSVTRVERDFDSQPEAMSAAANDMISRGHEFIVPFDSDEFWIVGVQELREVCAKCVECCFVGRWRNFVQRRDGLSPSALGLMRMVYRATRMEDANRETVTSFHRPFVGLAERKLGIKTRHPIKIGRGQHVLVEGPQQRAGPEFEIFHLPLRYRAELTKRAQNYEPRFRRADLETGWQSWFHAEMVAAGRIDELWAACSYDAARELTVGGRKFPLERDVRLRRVLARAWAYVALRWPKVLM